jgi:hypothetical protein
MNMDPNTIRCPICGHRFDPELHMACRTCPLQRGCKLVCCPVCGYETVNAEDSTLARLAKRFIERWSDKPAGPSKAKIEEN